MKADPVRMILDRDCASFFAPSIASFRLPSSSNNIDLHGIGPRITLPSSISERAITRWVVTSEIKFSKLSLTICWAYACSSLLIGRAVEPMSFLLPDFYDGEIIAFFSIQLLISENFQITPMPAVNVSGSA